MAGFVQIIEFKTSRPQAIQAHADEMEERDDQADSNTRPTPLSAWPRSGACPARSRHDDCRTRRPRPESSGCVGRFTRGGRKAVPLGGVRRR